MKKIYLTVFISFQQSRLNPLLFPFIVLFIYLFIYSDLAVLR
jgi:hypothetical protein